MNSDPPLPWPSDLVICIQLVTNPANRRSLACVAQTEIFLMVSFCSSVTVSSSVSVSPVEGGASSTNLDDNDSLALSLRAKLRSHKAASVPKSCSVFATWMPCKIIGLSIFGKTWPGLVKLQRFCQLWYPLLGRRRGNGFWVFECDNSLCLQAEFLCRTTT